MEAKHWKKEHTDFLLSNYKSMSFKELSENMERSIESIRSKLKRLGFSKDPKNTSSKPPIIIKSLIGKAANISAVATKKRRPKVYESSNQDLNKMIPVQIDHKTTIYIKAGKDPIEARQKYLERISERPKF